MKKTIFALCSLFCVCALQAQNTPYITHVWEYMPAPGQFVHELPTYTAGDDAESMRQKAEEQIANNAQGMISLGGWGGYVVFSFDHPVVNVPGENDLIVEGNAFYTDATQGAAGGGSCEPGIVMVSVDANANGFPDDEWFELAGSEYTNPLTKHGYSVTYYRTETHENVPWQDNEQQTGVIAVNNFHKQNYYPIWAGDSLCFTGARLPDNYAKQGNQYVLYPYEYGYADNHPDTARFAQLNIEWAVRTDGSPIHLSTVDFIKVYTALHQQVGSLGETSTEIKGARDLHPDAAPTGIIDTNSETQATKTMRNGQLLIQRDNKTYNSLGIQINNN